MEIKIENVINECTETLNKNPSLKVIIIKNQTKQKKGELLARFRNKGINPNCIYYVVDKSAYGSACREISLSKEGLAIMFDNSPESEYPKKLKEMAYIIS